MALMPPLFPTGANAESVGNQLRERLRNWLSPPNPSINHNIACGSHHDGTAMWFINGHSHKEWKSSSSLLWVHGNRIAILHVCVFIVTDVLLTSQLAPVKAFLRMLFIVIDPQTLIFPISSVIIEDIKAMCDAGLASSAYFYFDYKDSLKRDIRSLLSSILSQLCGQSDHSWSILSQLYTVHCDGEEQPSEDALIKCLQSMLNVQGQPPTYIVIDAVDECPTIPGIPSPREKVLDLVKDLVISHPDLRICVTSRCEKDIWTVLEDLTSRHICLHDQTGQKADIAEYVRYVVHSDQEMRRWRLEDKELVIKTLTERAQGM
jgi:hypothetical protein